MAGMSAAKVQGEVSRIKTLPAAEQAREYGRLMREVGSNDALLKIIEQGAPKEVIAKARELAAAAQGVAPAGLEGMARPAGRTAAQFARAGGAREVNLTWGELKFESAAKVVPSQDRTKATRFSLPIPAFDGKPLVYPSHFPKDMRNKDGTPHADAGKPHPQAGQAIEVYGGGRMVDAEGNPQKGVVFFNYEDAKFQGVESSGSKVILMARKTADFGKELEGFVASLGGPSALNSVDKVTQVLEFAKSKGMDDQYDSSMTYATSKLTAIKDQATGVSGYGLHLRANEQVPAVFVAGPGRIGDISFGPEGAVFTLHGNRKGADGKELVGEDGQPVRDIRKLTPEHVEQNFVGADGQPLRASSLPRGI